MVRDYCAKQGKRVGLIDCLHCQIPDSEKRSVVAEFGLIAIVDDAYIHACACSERKESST